MAAPDLADLGERLGRWAVDHHGPDASVADVEVMPGHAGLSFGFTAEWPGGSEALVVRMPPKGVRRSGNTDVLRQVPLLQALLAAGVPVPEVRWWSDDERWFEVPFTMVERLPGRTLNLRDPDPSFDTSPDALGALFDQAIDALASVHAIDWRTALAGWEEPRALDDEVRFWDRLLAKGAEPQWVGEGETVRDLLLDHLPNEPPVGLFHGDFQTNNLLFDGQVLSAVLDWEISGIGGHLLDLGWLLCMTDPGHWDPVSVGSMGLAPGADRVVARYEEARGVPAPDVAWYQALSGYRFGVITAFNVMLHRSGKRPDDVWDTLASSTSTLFSRAADLLRGAPLRS